MVFLTDAAQQGAEVPGVDFWAAVLSFLTALVVTAGPPILRRVFPGDSTVADIALASTNQIATTLNSTLDLVKKDMQLMRDEIKENGQKIDALNRGRK